VVDPLAEVVALLQPSARFSKLIHGASPWRIRRSDTGQPFYCAVLEGGCVVSLPGREPLELHAGDFALIPAVQEIAIASLLPPPRGQDTLAPTSLGNGEFRLGPSNADVDLRMVAGHCSFESPDAALLVSLLPQLVHVRGTWRLATLVELVREETREQRPARDVVLSRLMEVLLIEALRSTAGTHAPPGLVRGLADARLGAAVRQMHERPQHAWTVPELAKAAALSRSTFFERFSRELGVSPMEYLLAWRMALAKNLLRRKVGRMAEVAERVGYSSASTFSVAFTRHVGQPPTRYAHLHAHGTR